MLLMIYNYLAYAQFESSFLQGSKYNSPENQKSYLQKKQSSRS